MKKVLVKCLVLTCVLTTMSVSTAFAGVSQSSVYQQQQVEQIRQQNEALKQQNGYLMQQTEILRQQTEALKQSQMNTHPVQAYAPSPVYYAPAPAPVYYAQSQVYSPGPWYGGMAAGYMLGQFSGYGRGCSRGWGRGCGRGWH